MSATAAFVDRHERTRANWILAHEASWHLSDRRRANQLQRRANQIDRDRSGAAESAHHEGRIAWLGQRWMNGGDSASEKLARFGLLLLVAGPVVLFTVGPALAIAAGLYYLLWLKLPAQGKPLRELPWLVAGGTALMAGAVVLALIKPVIASYHLWSGPLDVHTVPFLLLSLWWYGSLGMLLTGLRIRQFGWPGVKTAANNSTTSKAKLPSLTRTSTGTPRATAPADAPAANAAQVAPAATQTQTADVEADLSRLSRLSVAAPVATQTVRQPEPEQLIEDSELEHEPWMDVEFDDAPLLEDDIINDSKEN